MTGLPLDANELAVVFGYKNKRGVNRAVRTGMFPIPTYSFEGRRYAHPDHVQDWLDLKKREAIDEFESWDR